MSYESTLWGYDAKLDNIIEIVENLEQVGGRLVWNKSEIGERIVERETTHTATFYVTDGSSEAIKIYYSKNYTKDETNHTYTLTNPTEIELPLTSWITIPFGNYIAIGSATTDAIYQSQAISGYGTKVANYTEGINIIPHSANYPTWAHEFVTETTYTVIECVLSNNENMYPDGGVQDGYYYERRRALVELENYDEDRIPRKVVYSIPNMFTGKLFYFSGAEHALQTEVNSYPDVIEIFGQRLVEEMFYNAFLYFNGKLKIKVKSIGPKCFYGLGRSRGLSNEEKYAVFMSADIETIDDVEPANRPFSFGNEFLVFYCEPASKPDGWGQYWNYSSTLSQYETHWGISEEDFDAL